MEGVDLLNHLPALHSIKSKHYKDNITFLGLILPCFWGINILFSVMLNYCRSGLMTRAVYGDCVISSVAAFMVFKMFYRQN